jgi:hypothetical protein
MQMMGNNILFAICAGGIIYEPAQKVRSKAL